MYDRKKIRSAQNVTDVSFFVVHTSRLGHESEIPISTLRTSYMFRGFQNVFDIPVLSRKSWCTKLSSSHHIELAKRS